MDGESEKIDFYCTVFQFSYDSQRNPAPNLHIYPYNGQHSQTCNSSLTPFSLVAVLLDLKLIQPFKRFQMPLCIFIGHPISPFKFASCLCRFIHFAYIIQQPIAFMNRHLS